MDTVLLTNDYDRGIALVTLNRPHVHNAISLQLTEELTQALMQCRDDKKINVVVITGAGRSFVSGGDLQEFGAVKGREQSYPLLKRVSDLLQMIADFPKPTIAMINGAAIGGGCELATSCHFRFASEKAMFGFVQIGMHITTGWGGGSRLLQVMNEPQALMMLLTGERITARKALQLGFLHHVAPEEKLLEETLDFAAKIAKQPQESIMAYMRILSWKRAGLPIEERVEQEIEQCAELWGSPSHHGAIEEFLHKK